MWWWCGAQCGAVIQAHTHTYVRKNEKETISVTIEVYAHKQQQEGVGLLDYIKLYTLGTKKKEI